VHLFVSLYIYIFIYLFVYSPSVAPRPNTGHGLLILDVSRPQTTTNHSRLASSGRVISASQRPLPDKTQHSQQTDIHVPLWDSNPQSQQASGRKPTPYTARQLGLAFVSLYIHLITKYSTRKLTIQSTKRSDGRWGTLSERFRNDKLETNCKEAAAWWQYHPHICLKYWSE